MSEYIDRAAAVAISDYAADEHPYEKMGSWENSSEYNEGWNDACDYIREKLENEPAADVAEVVRCKDCKWHESAHGVCDLTSNESIKNFIDRLVHENDFCSYGERKEPGDD